VPMVHLFREVSDFFGFWNQEPNHDVNAQIAAEGSILQLLPNPCIAALREFLANPSNASLPNIKPIPALYEALRYEYFEQGRFYEDTLEVCNWLAKRADEVLSVVIQHKDDPLDECFQSANDWRKVCTYTSIVTGK
jgi:hypothetical protein